MLPLDPLSPLGVVCHEGAVCVQRCGTVREMKEGPSRPAVRCRSHATASCCRQERWWCCVKKVRERHAVREMKEDPSEPSCRGRLQQDRAGAFSAGLFDARGPNLLQKADRHLRGAA